MDKDGERFEEDEGIKVRHVLSSCEGSICIISDGRWVIVIIQAIIVNDILSLSPSTPSHFHGFFFICLCIFGNKYISDV